MQAAVSSVPLVWGDGLVAFLDAYPYPCTEQLVSKGFAALLLASRPEFGTVKTVDTQPIGSTLLDAAKPRERSGRFRVVVVFARYGRVPHSLRGELS